MRNMATFFRAKRAAAKLLQTKRQYSSDGIHKNFANFEEAVQWSEKSGAKLVSLRYVDSFGKWHHTKIPLHQLGADKFLDGQYFDGSSIRAWQG